MKNHLTRKFITITATASLALLVNIGANAEIYKWTDAKGVVHYTANKPTQKKIQSENIEVKIRSAAGKYQPTKTASRMSDDSPERESGKEPGSGKLSGPDPKLVSYCKQQRSNLTSLKKHYRTVWQGADGKKKQLNQEERKLKVSELEEKISEDCAGI